MHCDHPGSQVAAEQGLKHRELENRNYEVEDLGASGSRPRSYVLPKSGRIGTNVCPQSVACQMQILELELVEALQKQVVQLPPCLGIVQPTIELRHVEAGRLLQYHRMILVFLLQGMRLHGAQGLHLS